MAKRKFYNPTQNYRFIHFRVNQFSKIDKFEFKRKQTQQCSKIVCGKIIGCNSTYTIFPDSWTIYMVQLILKVLFTQ